jgi:hypothetical protein
MFYKNKGNSTGYKSECKQCGALPRDILNKITEQRCTICKIVKPISEFYIDYRCRDGHVPRCKECTNKAHRLSHQKRVAGNTDENIAKVKRTVHSKYCRICHQVKPLASFNVRRSFADGHMPFCKKCQSKINEISRKKLMSLPEDELNKYLTERAHRMASYNTRIKVEVLSHYSDKPYLRCANPYGVHDGDVTDIDVLTLDHIHSLKHKSYSDIDGNGRRIGGSTLYRKLKRLNYPLGYQVLCGACQMKKIVVNGERKRKYHQPPNSPPNSPTS